MDKELHRLAREECARLKLVGYSIDKKQVRYNDIVDCSKLFYKGFEKLGLSELLKACAKDSDLYSKKPMHSKLRDNYQWMLGT